jgi:adenylate cyclase
MGTEIERRFRVNLERLSPNGEDGEYLPRGKYIKQGYLGVAPSIRIRLVSWDDKPATSSNAVGQAMLTIKGKGSVTRAEWNLRVNAVDGWELITLAEHGVVEKVRYDLKVYDTKWELDRFLGVHEGLWLAEVELPSADAVFDRPPWLGEEVTEDDRYSNARLAQTFCRFWDDT